MKLSTLTISLLCPWRLDGHSGGQLGLDSGQGQDFSLLHDVQTGSVAHQASHTLSTGGSFTGYENLSKLFNFSSSFISYRIPSNAGYFG
jgi:hypothetical protein